MVGMINCMKFRPKEGQTEALFKAFVLSKFKVYSSLISTSAIVKFLAFTKFVEKSAKIIINNKKKMYRYL